MLVDALLTALVRGMHPAPTRGGTAIFRKFPQIATGLTIDGSGDVPRAASNVVSGWSETL